MERFNVTESEAFEAGSNVQLRGRGEKIGSAGYEVSPQSRPYNMNLSSHPMLRSTAYTSPAKAFGFYIKGRDGGPDKTKTVDIESVKRRMKSGFDMGTGEATAAMIIGHVATLDDAELRAEVATLLSLGMLDEAVLYLRGIRVGLDTHGDGLPNKNSLKESIDQIYDSILNADFEAFGVEDEDRADDFLKYQVFEVLSEGKPDYDNDLHEALRATPEEIVKKLSTYPRDEISRVGVPRFIDPAPLSYGESDFKNVKPILEALRSVTRTKRSKEDSLVDGPDVEDGIVTFYKKALYSGKFSWIVSRSYGSKPVWVSREGSNEGLPSGDISLDDVDSAVAAMRYKLTSWAMEGLVERATNDSSGNWSISSGAQIDRATLGPGGYMYVNVDDQEAALNSYGPDAVKTFTYTDPDGRFTITAKTGVDNYFLAINGAVDVTFSSLDPSESDIRDALMIAGVTDPRPARKQDIRALAENRLISIFGGFLRDKRLTSLDRAALQSYLGKDYEFVDAKKNASGKAREMILEALETHYGVTADDIEIFVGENGLVEMRLSDEAVELFMDETGVDAFHHSVFTDTNTPEETAEKVINLLLGSEDGSIVAGLQSTLERFRSGKQVEGMSSSSDMNSGGADYVYLGPGEAPAYGIAQRQVYLEFSAKNIFRRGEVFANRYDRFGRRDGHDNVVSEITPHMYEMMVKRHLGPEGVTRVVVSKEVKAAIIARLKRFGITTMYGVPIQDFFVTGGA